MLKWTIEKIRLELKFTWKIARNSSDFKDNFIVRVGDGSCQGAGEIAPNIRYGESSQLITDQFEKFVNLKSSNSILDMEDFHQVLKDQNFCHALSFGISSAFLDFTTRKNGRSIHQYFNLAMPQSIPTSFSLPIMDVAEIKDFLKGLERFSSLKIKVDSQSAIDTISEVTKHTDQKLRIDGNEGWKDTDDFFNFYQTVKNKNIEFIEQPFPASSINCYLDVKGKINFPIIADESVEDDVDFYQIKKMFDGINVKLMKAGSHQNAVSLLRAAREHGLKTMLGCMIESSLGISMALEIATLADYVDLDGSLLIKNDPFTLITECNGLLDLSSNIYQKQI